MAEEPERKKKLIEMRKRKREQKRTEPKHHFNDSSYMAQIRSTEENIDAALEQGIHAASLATAGVKRKLPGESSSSNGTKKQKIW